MLAVREFFTRSNRIHIRFRPVESTEELVHLIDRFVDGPLCHEMEWDDFVSWKNDNPHVEEIRGRITEFEPLFFSQNRDDRIRFCNELIKERNKIAVMLKISERKSM